jgi:hypothetical protein
MNSLEPLLSKISERWVFPSDFQLSALIGVHLRYQRAIADQQVRSLGNYRRLKAHG